MEKCVSIVKAPHVGSGVKREHCDSQLRDEEVASGEAREYS